jgi:hypothetical protein
MVKSILELATDKALETEGVWVDIGNGVEVRVARIGNPAYRARMKKLGKPYRHLLRDDESELPDGLLEKLTVDAIAHTVLLDWRGPAMVDGEGQPIPFSPEKAVELLTGIDWFRERVEEAARMRETFRRREVEAAEKNSGTASATNSRSGRTSAT